MQFGLQVNAVQQARQFASQRGSDLTAVFAHFRRDPRQSQRGVYTLFIREIIFAAVGTADRLFGK